MDEMKQKNTYLYRTFSPTIAIDVGIQAAIVFQYIYGWISENSSHKTQKQEDAYAEGRQWMYVTYKGIHESLPYIKFSAIGKCVNMLQEYGYLIVKERMKHKGDRRKWYAVGPVGESPNPSIKTLVKAKIEYANRNIGNSSKAITPSSVFKDSIISKELLITIISYEAKASLDDALRLSSDEKDLENGISPKNIINKNNKTQHTFPTPLEDKEKIKNKKEKSGDPVLEVEDRHKKELISLCTFWKGEGGTNHTIPSIENWDEGQKGVIHNVYNVLKEFTTNPKEFFINRSDLWDPKWINDLDVFGVTLDNIQQGIKFAKKQDTSISNMYDLVKYAGRKHLAFYRDAKSKLPKEQKQVKMHLNVMPPQLDKFIYTEISNRSTGKTVCKSWFLYWLCRPIHEAKQKQAKEAQIEAETAEQQMKFPEGYTHKLYGPVDKLFNVNRKIPGKTSVVLKNASYTLSDALIEHLIMKGKNNGIKIGTVTDIMNKFEEFFKQQDFGDWQYDPKYYMPGRSTWNRFIDFLIEKKDNPYVTKNYGELKVTIES